MKYFRTAQSLQFNHFPPGGFTYSKYHMPGDFHNFDFDIRIYHTFMGKKSPKKCMSCNESEKAMKRGRAL